MSLLDEAMEKFVLVNRIKTSDGYGGTENHWVDGAVIDVAVQYNDSKEMQVAQAQGVTSVYVFTVRKNIQLDYHDVLRRVSDGKIFRITSNSDDWKTPASATLNMLNYAAEEWEIPADGQSTST